MQNSSSASPTPIATPLLQPVTWWKLTAPLWVLGVLLSVGVFLTSRGGSNLIPLTILCQLPAPFAAAAACFWALRRTNNWAWRSRVAWSAIGISALCFALGQIVLMVLVRRFITKDAVVSPPTFADFWFVIQQPLLWVGLLLLAWRGRSLGMMRLLIDTLIVVLAAVVLSWTVVLERRFLDPETSSLAKGLAIYYPIAHIAHLFCALMVVANVRERPALARAAGFLLGGVACLILSDAVNSTPFLNPLLRVPTAWLSIAQLWSYLLFGMAALIHSWAPQRDAIAPDSPAEDAANLATPTSDEPSHWDKTLARWHRSAMLWLPYAATLGVSGVLIGQEMRTNTDSLQRLLPVVSLLMAIVARQMLTLWDNLQLTEQMQLSHADLERNVVERTRHLATLHGITSTLNTSLDRRTVLRITLEKTIAAVYADGGGIWLRTGERESLTASHESEWTLVHWQGFESDATTQVLLRDLAIAAAEQSDSTLLLSPETRRALQSGQAPPAHRSVLVPVRWQGTLLGVMGLLRREGAFSYEDRALVESVALEAGTALQNARLYSEAAHRADRDSVTDLFNHRAVQEQLNAMLSRCKRTGGQFGIVMMDLNNFKFFNDTYGHPVGDDVLRTVARALRESCRTSDILGRYGGDEFIALLPDNDEKGTIEACQRISADLDRRHFEPVPGTQLPISIAFGWALFPGDGDNALELLTQADAKLYNHKRGGTSYLTHSAADVQEGRDEMRRLKNRAWGGSFGVLDALVTAIDNKDHYTRHHSEEVTFFSLLVAKELAYSPEALRAVRISGLLHDVGKIAVPDDILRHPGKLGKEEWDIMQQHPVFGALIVKDVPNLEEVMQGIRHHHERWDGSGYPDKLAGANIPLMGRLLAMGDVYSALTTDRPYRKGWTSEAALEEIEKCAGSHFDPQLCEVFLRVMRREIAGLGVVEDYGSRISDQFSDEAIGTKINTDGDGAATLDGAEPVQISKSFV